MAPPSQRLVYQGSASQDRLHVCKTMRWHSQRLTVYPSARQEWDRCVFLALPAVETRRRVHQGRCAPLFWWESGALCLPQVAAKHCALFPRNERTEQMENPFVPAVRCGPASRACQSRQSLPSDEHCHEWPGACQPSKPSGHCPLATITYSKAQVRGKPKTR